VHVSLKSSKVMYSGKEVIEYKGDFNIDSLNIWLNEKYGNDLAAINIKEKYTIENRENKIYYFLPKSFTQKEILDHIRDDRIGELW